MTDILALDIATRCGFARGIVGGAPQSGSIWFAKYDGASDNSIFGNFLTWLSSTLEPQPRPDVVVIEAMLPPQARPGETNRGTRDRLAGLHGIARAVCFLRGIYRFEAVSVGDVRGHFIGERSLKRDAAKRAVIEQCHRLGWPCADDNAADALALWDYACARFDPTLGIKRTPLFRSVA